MPLETQEFSVSSRPETDAEGLKPPAEGLDQFLCGKPVEPVQGQQVDGT